MLRYIIVETLQLFIMLSLLMSNTISTYALQSFCANIFITFKLRTVAVTTPDRSM